MSRTHHHGKINREAIRRLVAPQYHLLGSPPKWWDVEFHTRPKRRVEQRALYDARVGDPDGVVYPVGSRKPRIYYW